MIPKEFRGILKETEIKSIEKLYYNFIVKNKVVVFVPESHRLLLTEAMSKTGAGVIGEYTMCSFYTNGKGTFKPSSKAKPFSGTKLKFSEEDECRLEMECTGEILDKVIDSLLAVHPYDEPVYEIYEFKTISRNKFGQAVTLKKPVKFSVFLQRINPHISETVEDFITKIAFFEKDADIKNAEKNASRSGCSHLAVKNGKAINIIKI